MLQTVQFDDAKIRLRDLIDAALNGETVLIAREDQSVVQLMPIKQMQYTRQFGSAHGLVTMTDDFDAPLEDFSDYMA
jgi:antitoxin (DNA-binding transcriptional repressor) of toxin-antitoxin stability system